MKDFNLKKPCSNCPFRGDEQAIKLMPGRREGIISQLLTGQIPSFPCHKTVYRKGRENFDDEDQYQPTDICHCPGAIAVCQKFGRDPVVVQIGVRLGVIAENHYAEALELSMEPGELDIDLKDVHL